MELKYFRLIKTITEEGSISNSADKLFLTQSALSHQLRDLEERLGFKVFLRSRNKWKLTSEGEELYNLSNKVLNEITTGFDKIAAIKKGSKGKIRISTECYSFYQGLPSFIQKMGILYPEIEIEVDIESTQKPIIKILNKELDLAIVGNKSFEKELAYIPLFNDEIFALMHKEHPLNKRDHLDVIDFRKLHLIIHSFPLETVSIHQLVLEKHQIAPQKITAIPMTEVSLDLVKANMGVMCMPKWALRSFKIPEEVIFKKIGSEGLHRTHSLVMRKEDLNRKYIKDFIESIKEEFESGI